MMIFFFGILNREPSDLQQGGMPPSMITDAPKTADRFFCEVKIVFLGKPWVFSI